MGWGVWGEGEETKKEGEYGSGPGGNGQDFPLQCFRQKDSVRDGCDPSLGATTGSHGFGRFRGPTLFLRVETLTVCTSHPSVFGGGLPDESVVVSRGSVRRRDSGSRNKYLVSSVMGGEAGNLSDLLTYTCIS